MDYRGGDQYMKQTSLSVTQNRAEISGLEEALYRFAKP